MSDVAAALGVSPSTVRRRRLAMTYDKLRPPETLRSCSIEVWLYDVDQTVELKRK